LVAKRKKCSRSNRARLFVDHRGRTRDKLAKQGPKRQHR